jgi:hypothetical protein
LSKIAHRIEQIVLSAVSQHHFHRLFTSWAGVTPKAELRLSHLRWPHCPMMFKSNPAQVCNGPTPKAAMP